jgi:hypothetical protein
MRDMMSGRAAALTLLLLPAGAAAQDQTPPRLVDQVGLTGSLRAGYWSSTRNLDAEAPVGATMLWLKAARPVSDGIAYRVEGWLSARGPLDHGEASGELREAYLDVRRGRFDVRVGRQIIAWGRADGINPTDNVTGQDLTVLVPDEDDGRLGTTAVRAGYHFGDVSLTALWLPEFRPHRVPLPATPPGLALDRHATRWPGDQWAVRIEQTGRAVDWSASYMRGLDLAPDLGLRQRAGAPPAIQLAHHRIGVVGGDMAGNVGHIGLRAEGAYVRTEDATGRDPFTKNPYLFLVVGGDRTFREYLNLNVQYIYRRVFDRAPLPAGLSVLEQAIAAQQAVLNGETRAVQHGLSFRVSYKWFRETLEGECAAAGFVEPGGVTIRPKLTYAVSDHWKWLVGAELFRGERSALFGLLRPNSTAYVEARWSF